MLYLFQLIFTQYFTIFEIIKQNMRHYFTKHFVVLIFMSFGSFLFAQSGKKTSTQTYPVSFTIDLKELDQLFLSKTNSVVQLKSNKYLTNSKVVLNSSYKDNKQLKLKLSYFKNAELIVQINGKDSKIIYILSSDDSIFYNSANDSEKITLTQCRKDDIISD